MQTLNLRKTYNKYSEYKDSETEWIGTVPKSWHIEKFKFIASCKKGKNPEEFLPVQDGGAIPYLSMEYLRGDIDSLNFAFPENRVLANNTDTILLWDGSNAGEFIPSKLGIVSSTASVVKFKKIDKRFGFYFSKVFEKYLKDQTMGMGIPHVDGELVSNASYAFPSPVEQTSIVNYLNDKTSFVDQIIEKKEKLIELLGEKRTAVINQAVTKGLDPKEEFMDSGVEWIGKYPKHWRIERLKFIAPLRNKKIVVCKDKEKYIGLENIESGTGRFIEVEQESEPESVLNNFSTGDVLFGKLRPYLAKVFVPNFGGVSTGELLALLPDKEKVGAKYLFYKLISKDFIKIIDDSTYGTKMPRASWNFIGNQFIVFPPISEQKIVVTILDEKTSLIDQIINSVEVSIKLLQEFKSSLISNVATGKVKV